MTEDELRAAMDARTALARELFEQQFIRCGGRKPGDPTWDEIPEWEREQFRTAALDAGPLIERARVEGRAVDAAIEQHALLAVRDRLPGHVQRLMDSCTRLMDERDEALADAERWRRLVDQWERNHQTEVLPYTAKLEAEVERERASRQAWATEAMRLQHFLETKMFPGVFGDTEPPIYPTVCACLTDEQTAQLGAGFARPQCAVHPETGGDL